MFRRTLVGLILAAVVASGCSSGSGAEAPPSTTAGPTTSTSSASTSTSTTTTPEAPARRFEPLYADPALSVEDQVEAAYLFHWEVLLEALRTGRGDLLPVAYVGSSLEMRKAEVDRLHAAGEIVTGGVLHDYEIVVLDDDNASVVDGYVNNLTRVDAETGSQIEEPSGEVVVSEFQMRKTDGQWLVRYIVTYESAD